MALACDTLLTAAFILTQNESREVIEDGFIAIQDGRICGLGPCQEAAAYAPQTHIDLPQAMLLPGFTNAHTHVAMTFMRGLADDMDLMDWLNNYVFPAETMLTRELVYAATMLGCAEMLRTGTTAFCDMYLFEDAVCEAVDKAGLKMLGGEAVFGFSSAAASGVEANFENVLRLHERWKGHPRIKTAVMPHSVYTTNAAILERCRAVAEQTGQPVHIHLAETTSETEKSYELYGMRPLECLERSGLLHKRTCLAHAVDLTMEEIDLLASLSVSVAHNPKSNMKLASGVAPVLAMLQAGVAVGLGTDGAASNNTLNMVSEMGACALMHKLANKDSSAMSAQTALDMATLHSATTLHSTDTGCLKAGYAADVVAFDLSGPNMQPVYSPVSQAVYAASGYEVCMTMVDGQVLYKDGCFSSLDYDLCMREMNTIAKHIKKRLL